MYARPSFVGYSLWLIPKEPVKSSLQGIIDRYSSEHSTVSFEPHVTLLAGVEPKGGVGEIISKTEKLASDLKVLPARVEGTACKDLYFQSVFALLTTDEALLEAHKTARALFGQDPDGATDYMPHVSLLYGDLPMATREAIRQDAEPTLIGAEFELDHLQVWSTKDTLTWFPGLVGLLWWSRTSLPTTTKHWFLTKEVRRVGEAMEAPSTLEDKSIQGAGICLPFSKGREKHHRDRDMDRYRDTFEPQAP